MPKKPNPRAALDLLPTYLGACKAISARTGEPCKRFVVYADGLCRQHSPTKLGQDEKEAIEQRARELVKIEVAKFKEKRARRAARKPKWREALSKICSQTAADAKVSTAKANRAALAKSSGPRKAPIAAASTPERLQARAHPKENKEPLPISPAPRPSKEEHAPTQISSSLAPVKREGVPKSSEQAKPEQPSGEGNLKGEIAASARAYECVPPVMDYRVVPGQAYVARCRAQLVAELKMRRDPYSVTSPERHLVEPEWGGSD